MSIELESLVGEHELSGAYFDSIEETEHGYTESREVLRFTLDGKNYEAVEDSNDGYRSALGELRLSDTAPVNTFPPRNVVGRMKTSSETYFDDRVLQFINPNTGNIILEIGTTDCSDYYPGFVAYFSPENL